MKDKQSIHEKAIRLLEGGIVDVDGHSVRLNIDCLNSFACDICEMDCLCHGDTEMCSVCVECANILNEECFLEFAYKSSDRP